VRVEEVEPGEERGRGGVAGGAPGRASIQAIAVSTGELAGERCASAQEHLASNPWPSPELWSPRWLAEMTARVS
jgi:hypothetical protein